MKKSDSKNNDCRRKLSTHIPQLSPFSLVRRCSLERVKAKYRLSQKEIPGALMSGNHGGKYV